MVEIGGYFCGCGFPGLFFCWQHLYNSIQDVVGGVTLSPPAGGKGAPKNTPTTTKTQSNQRAHINGIKGIPRASGSGNQGDCTTESHRSPTIQGHTIKTRSQSRSIKYGETNKKSN